MAIQALGRVVSRGRFYRASDNGIGPESMRRSVPGGAEKEEGNLFPVKEEAGQSQESSNPLWEEMKHK